MIFSFRVELGELKRVEQCEHENEIQRLQAAFNRERMTLYNRLKAQEDQLVKISTELSNAQNELEKVLDLTL